MNIKKRKLLLIGLIILLLGMIILLIYGIFHRISCITIVSLILSVLCMAYLLMGYSLKSSKNHR